MELYFPINLLLLNVVDWLTAVDFLTTILPLTIFEIFLEKKYFYMIKKVYYFAPTVISYLGENLFRIQKLSNFSSSVSAPFQRATLT